MTASKPCVYRLGSRRHYCVCVGGLDTHTHTRPSFCFLIFLLLVKEARENVCVLEIVHLIAFEHFGGEQVCPESGGRGNDGEK